MKYASVERCPVLLGSVKSYDASEALKIPGVEKVVEIPAVKEPVEFQALGGLAVVASNTWAAAEGRKRSGVAGHCFTRYLKTACRLSSGDCTSSICPASPLAASSVSRA